MTGLAVKRGGQIAGAARLVLSTEYMVRSTRRGSAFVIVFAAASLLLSGFVCAEFPRVPPTPPEQAEGTFEVQHGFRMELIAAEPMVASPVDMAFDEDGRAYVVEMRDYPYPEEKNAAPTEFPGTVRLLEDTDEDGKFDRATVFADTLAWPTSVCCFKGGVFVAAAPDIWYFKDTDGDRKADVRRKVFTGFSRYNVQAIMNSLRWGPDNQIYGAAAGNGGTVRHAERPEDPVIQLTRRDFRFDPVTEKIEAIAGGERFGACFDDWGNRFLCNIRNPVQHAVLPLHYVQRNPHFIEPSLIQDCAESGDQLRVFRISPPEPWRQFRAQRWSLEGANMPRSELIGAGFWTSSSGVTVYRGGAYPEPFRGNVFIGEVAGNLVHRQILERDGATFKSRRADENTEFVRSRDNWFRPVNFVNAPDGTLLVLDMYRETIEHPWSIPDDIKAQVDLTSGKERGRIYRLRPPGFENSKTPKLGSFSSERLVGGLVSPHSWVRDTAQRLIFEQRDPAASAMLRQLFPSNLNPVSKLHILYLLESLGDLQDSDLVLALQSRQPDLVRHAVKLAEGRLGNSPVLERAVLGRASDADAAVRCQLAMSIGPADDRVVADTLLNLAARDGKDPWLRVAVLSSAGKNAGSLLRAALEREIGGGGPEAASSLVKQLAFCVGAGGPEPAILDSLKGASQSGLSIDTALEVLSGLGEGLARQKKKLADYLPGLSSNDSQNLASFLGRLNAIASNSTELPRRRVGAIELGSMIASSGASNPLIDYLDPAQPREVQQAALRVFSTKADAANAGELINRWKRLTPPLREEAVNVLLSRPVWHEALIGAMERGEVPVAQVSIPQRGRLAAIKDEKLAARVKTLLEQFVLGSRKEVVEKYQTALSLSGDGGRGQVVYRRECANCHKLRGEGHEVGPSLETVQHRSPQEILIHVLDPNREVSPNFLEYVVRMTDGRVVTGLISADSDAGLTLKRAQNLDETVSRGEIEEMTASGKSLMPEGVEQKVTPQEMADLIAFLRSGI